jgi:hypothetical protein
LPSALAPALIAALAGAVAAKFLAEPTSTPSTTRHASGRRSARSESKTALAALAVATALTHRLGLTRQAGLPETAASTEALFAPLLAHCAGDARQMRIG